MKKSVVISDKETMGGTPVIKGTRVPSEFLFEYLERGKSIKDFIKSYPTVKKKQAIEVIKLAEKLILRGEE